MSGALRLVLGDQLTEDLSALDGWAPGDCVLMVEAAAETTYVRHHKQKIALILAAMRKHAAALRARGLEVDYVRLDDPDNRGTFRDEARRALARRGAARIIATEPGEWRVLADLKGWPQALGVPVEIRSDRRFLCSRARFAAWADGRRQLRMEFFYREMRRDHGVLLDAAGGPVGGRWNLDAENRKPLPPDLRAPTPPRFAPDAETRDVLDLVAARFPDHFGDLEPFVWAVTAEDAARALDWFLDHALPGFGDHQDAMRRGDDVLFHSLLSPYLNIGLLDPLTVIRGAEARWAAGAAPLNAVEGFVRQILGWREYVRGLYWTQMPAYAATNALDAQRPLPRLYYDGDTEMACLRAVVDQTRRRAYAHHIQRLMVTGNFALLAGLAPAEVERWYLEVFADAFEWVELPNTHGMALYADGGVMASKPYAASGAYIKRMSDYCRGCRYDVDLKSGPDACPFNALYWDFLDRNEARLSANPRLAMPYKTLARMDEDRRAGLRRDAARFLERLA